MSKPKYCDFYVFGVIDDDGEEQQDVCNEPSDTIWLAAWDNDLEGTRVFECDAYHLRDWAEIYGFTWFKRGYMYNDLPAPTVNYDD